MVWRLVARISGPSVPATLSRSSKRGVPSSRRLAPTSSRTSAGLLRHRRRARSTCLRGAKPSGVSWMPASGARCRSTAQRARDSREEGAGAPAPSLQPAELQRLRLRLRLRRRPRELQEPPPLLAPAGGALPETSIAATLKARELASLALERLAGRAGAAFAGMAALPTSCTPLTPWAPAMFTELARGTARRGTAQASSCFQTHATSRPPIPCRNSNSSSSRASSLGKRFCCNLTATNSASNGRSSWSPTRLFSFAMMASLSSLCWEWLKSS
mmetsp:Transcript_13891/g.43538  ORF Transcript_13891/g.43538 Transcript_13891/m.43538 type:complete len:272 (-) Transcript_13891:275-1090(-)